MFSKVRVKKAALNYFRKKARGAYPLEMQSYLVGNVLSVDEVEITEFKYTKEYATQTESAICWYAEDAAKVKAYAESKEQKVIGDIHSHPSWDAVMSDVDYNSAITESSLICGICSVYGKKTRVRFWTPTSALPCRITYI